MFEYNNYLQAMNELDEKTRNIRFLQACIGGELEKVQLLLDNKNLNVDMCFKDINGSDGFRWACIYKHENVVNELLIKYDYKIAKRNLNYITKRNEYFNGELDFVFEIMQFKEMSVLLNKSLKNSNVKSQTKNFNR